MGRSRGMISEADEKTEQSRHKSALSMMLLEFKISVYGSKTVKINKN